MNINHVLKEIIQIQRMGICMKILFIFLILINSCGKIDNKRKPPEYSEHSKKLESNINKQKLELLKQENNLKEKIKKHESRINYLEQGFNALQNTVSSHSMLLIDLSILKNQFSNITNQLESLRFVEPEQLDEAVSVLKDDISYSLQSASKLITRTNKLEDTQGLIASSVESLNNWQVETQQMLSKMAKTNLTSAVETLNTWHYQSKPTLIKMMDWYEDVVNIKRDFEAFQATVKKCFIALNPQSEEDVHSEGDKLLENCLKVKKRFKNLEESNQKVSQNSRQNSGDINKLKEKLSKISDLSDENSDNIQEVFSKTLKAQINGVKILKACNVSRYVIALNSTRIETAYIFKDSEGREAKGVLDAGEYYSDLCAFKVGDHKRYLTPLESKALNGMLSINLPSVCTRYGCFDVMGKFDPENGKPVEEEVAQ